MLNSIISGICEKLNEVFGDDVRIYKDEVKQGLQEPCFFVQLVAPTNTQQLGNRYYRKNLFGIQYIPKSETRSECSSVQDKLYLALEYITVGGDLWRGTEMRGELTDGILTFFVNFDSTVYKAVNSDPMEDLENTNIDVKGV